jgi:hypothetical protein
MFTYIVYLDYFLANIESSVPIWSTGSRQHGLAYNLHPGCASRVDEMSKGFFTCSHKYIHLKEVLGRDCLFLCLFRKGRNEGESCCGVDGRCGLGEHGGRKRDEADEIPEGLKNMHRRGARLLRRGECKWLGGHTKRRRASAKGREILRGLRIER